jgi:glycosyltransferase involved in cell wall biosynthesis
MVFRTYGRIRMTQQTSLVNDKKKPTISLCMIVKNEESCLGRCLKSACGFVDEIIVVDTGSTDRTVEIAKGHGARIYHHPWENDFSKHRNQSLAYATGDWILQLDADEELFGEDGSQLAAIAREGKADFYNCQFHDIKKDGSVHGVFNLIRFFRNGMGMNFERKVHNQLQTRGRGAYCGVRIRHYGYDLSPEQMEAKHIRTTTLLKEMLATDPEDAYSCHQLAASYSMHREFDKAVEQGEKALALMRRKGLRHEFFVTTFYTVTQGYYALADLEATERIGLEALDFFPMHLDICHLLASVYFKRQDLDRCRAMSRRYLEIHEAFTRDPSLIGSFYCHSLTKRNEIFFGLACIDFFEKNYEEADAFFRRSFEVSDRPRERAQTVCRFYLDRHMDEKAFQWLVTACEDGVPSEEASPAGPHPVAALGPLAYAAAEAFCLRREWPLAEKALQLAVRIAPTLFDHAKFDQLLRGA